MIAPDTSTYPINRLTESLLVLPALPRLDAMCCVLGEYFVLSYFVVLSRDFSSFSS